MILLAVPLAPGDAWTYEVSRTYADAEGPLLRDRERWSLRVMPGGGLAFERRLEGNLTEDGTLVPARATDPEKLSGRVGPDGTLMVEGALAEPTLDRLLRRLLKPDPIRDATISGFPVLRSLVRREAAVRLPGNDERAALRLDVRLVEARLGGRAAFH